MAQYDFGTIDPNTKSGTALATDLNSYRNAVNSMHSGSSAPSYITAGMMWVDTTSANYEVKLYDGAQSITVAIIDATNNVARVAVDPAETSYITSTTSAQIRHVIASTNIFTTRSTGIQFNLASPVIADSNNNELISFTTTASAVNHVDVANSATGGAVTLSAAGSDTNISLALMPKGAGNVGIGVTPSAGSLTHLEIGAVGNAITGYPADAAIYVTSNAVFASGWKYAQTGKLATRYAGEAGQHQFFTAPSGTAGNAITFTERMRIDSSGSVFIGTTSLDNTSAADVGFGFSSANILSLARSANPALSVGRQTDDGTIVSIRQAGTQEGSISVSGTTVSYNGGHLARWAQFPDNTHPDMLKGTVMSNLDQMSVWGDEDNEQLNCVQISAVEGDANVAGVFVAWDSEDDGYNDILLAMTGDMVIRIAAGTIVQRGDLLMSAGDGTAKPQGDDVVRSKTIAKVTSTHVSHTYADGSYAVPCVLMAC